MTAKVLIVTDSLISVKEPSLWAAIRKQARAQKRSRAPWLDLRLKLLSAELVLAQRRLRGSRRYRRADYHPLVEPLMSTDYALGAPELTEVVLATALRDAGMPFETARFGELFDDPGLRERLLAECCCVFASTTLLQHAAEMVMLLQLLKRPHNRVVAGGALLGIVIDELDACPGADVLAIGYGEWLVPALVRWIRSGFTTLEPPEGGRLVERDGLTILHSGVPATRDLDCLPRPDWELAGAVHGTRFELVHYESVRGCPYRCSFCNYPFLFDDRVFRAKSAACIAADWVHYAGHGVRYVSCLDSLFTMPRKRLIELCDLLIDAGVPVKWFCYARADDLGDPEVCELMARAGCFHVQVGIESGSPAVLEAMNKRCSVETNRLALDNCRSAGISTLASFIVGFPGETRQTYRDTLDFALQTRPDFYFASAFSVGFERLPILSEENRRRYGLVRPTLSAYWRHDSMSAADVGDLVRAFNLEVMGAGASLEASLHYQTILGYRRPEHRRALLDFQADTLRGGRLMRGTFRLVHAGVQRRLERDLRAAL